MKVKDIQKALKEAHVNLAKVDCSATYRELFNNDDDRLDVDFDPR